VTFRHPISFLFSGSHELFPGAKAAELWSSLTPCIYEDVSKSFRTGRLERELQMVQLSWIAILWVSLVSIAAITLCVASQRVFCSCLLHYRLSPETFGHTLAHVCVLVYTYTYACIHTYINTYIHTHTHIHISVVKGLRHRGNLSFLWFQN
jgi:hypothetical protein